MKTPIQMEAAKAVAEAMKEIEKLNKPTRKQLKARIKELEKVLKRFQEQYSLSPWIINACEKVLKK